jgi:hypothetical protein
MIKFRLPLAACILLLAATAFPNSASATDTRITSVPARQLAWETTPEGVAFASLTGDRFTEAYMAMVRLPAGLASPPHIKSANMFGVMISGAMIHYPAGANPAEQMRLELGSFYRIPKDLAHVSKCVSDEDCVTFLYQDGKFDFLPIGQ